MSFARPTRRLKRDRSLEVHRAIPKIEAVTRLIADRNYSGMGARSDQVAISLPRVMFLERFTGVKKGGAS